jgi:hypothetical protein
VPPQGGKDEKKRSANRREIRVGGRASSAFIGRALPGSISLGCEAALR